MTRLGETITIPGGVDFHVHLREPSDNKAETIESGTRAMKLGGYIAVVDMSNNPGYRTTTVHRVEEKYEIGDKYSHIRTGFQAGSQPEDNNLGEYEGMAILCLGNKSYLGKTTGNENEYTAFDFKDQWSYWHKVAPTKPIFVHRGSADLEDIIGVLGTDIGHPFHLCHVNHPNEVALVNKAQRNGVQVTCGVCPHHLFKTAHDKFGYGSLMDVQPPLADQIDAEQLWYMTVNGDIDCIESDHAPHPYEAKIKAEYNNGDCFGIPGGEFTMPLLLRQMIKDKISLKRIVELTSGKPAEIIGISVSSRSRATWLLEDYRFEDEENVKTGAGYNTYLGMLAVGRLRRLETFKGVLIDNFLETGFRDSKVLKERFSLV